MMLSALAETATTETAKLNINPAQVFCLVFDVYLIISGLASLITKKLYGTFGRAAGRYTEESLEKFVRPYGVCQLCFGIGMLVLMAPVLFFNDKNIPMIIVGGVIALAGAVGLCVAQKKILVKK